MKKLVIYVLCLLGMLSITTCKVAYNPPAVAMPNSYLVVEGLINIADSTHIKLSRTVNLSGTSTLNPELGSVVTIESNTGGSYALRESGNGDYAAPSFNLSAANQYRLRIKTTNGNQYISDFNLAMVSPPIDSVSWQAATDLKIYVSTHDPKNATRYYRWDFTETWQFHSNYYSEWVSDGDTVTLRTPAQQIYTCYATHISNNIVLGTSSGLSQDVVNQALVSTIPADQEKIGIKYSIMVRQYALTKETYSFWTLLKKNTEQLGSIFDAQPSASIGNIHCVTNPAEIVIGYINAGTITSSRIFIAKSQLPDWVPTPFYPDPTCELDTILVKNVIPHKPWQNEFINYKARQFLGNQSLRIPVVALYDPPPYDKLIYGWLSSVPMCVDCTLRGKTSPPGFWK